MATYGQIEAEVKRIVEDRIDTLDSAIVTHVARAQNAIEIRCAFPVQRALVTYQVGPPTTDYAKPADFINVRRAPYFLERTDSKQYSKLTEVDSFEDLGLLTKQGVPQYWCEKDDTTLQFWPIGDGLGPSGTTAGAYDIVIPYWKSLSALASANDTNWWSENLDDVLAWRAAATVFAEARDPMANWWMSVAAARFLEIRNQSKRNRIRQRETAIYPSQSLSSRTRQDSHGFRGPWISDLP